MKYLSLKLKQLFFEIVFGMVCGQPYEGFQNIPHIPILIIHH
jgi:hypothetical protein